MMLDLSYARATLEVKDGGVAEPLSWLEQSWKDPERFYRSLMQLEPPLGNPPLHPRRRHQPLP